MDFLRGFKLSLASVAGLMSFVSIELTSSSRLVLNSEHAVFKAVALRKGPSGTELAAG